MKDMKVTVNIDDSTLDPELFPNGFDIESIDFEALLYAALANAICTEEEKAEEGFPRFPAGVTASVEFGEEGEFDEQPLAAFNLEPYDSEEDFAVLGMMPQKEVDAAWTEMFPRQTEEVCSGTSSFSRSPRRSPRRRRPFGL